MFQLIKIIFISLLFLVIGCDDEEVDCAGVPNGNAWESDCGCVAADNLGDDCDDCAGVPNGSSLLDNCDTCNEDLLNDCVQDCAGTWGGDLVVDECDICGGSGPTLDCECDDIPEGHCDCDGNVLDECTECGGNNVTLQDFILDNSISPPCLPEEYKWSLTMSATLGEWEDDSFVPSEENASNQFIFGTHHLSTDELDLLNDLNYNDAVISPFADQYIYIYTPHPEWEYFVGDNFTEEYKLHNMNSLSTDEGIVWDGEMYSDNPASTKYIKFNFSLETEQSVVSYIDINFDDISNISENQCDSQLLFSNVYEINSICNTINENFEYIIPIYLGPQDKKPFSIKIINLSIYE